MIKWTCSQCGKSLQAPDERAGKKGKCPSCQTVVIVPGVPATQPIGAEPKPACSDAPQPTEPTPASRPTEVARSTAVHDDETTLEPIPEPKISAAPAPVPFALVMDDEPKGEPEEEIVEAVPVETVRFDCPRCGIGLKAPKTSVGRDTTCPGCKERVRIPSEEEPVAAFGVDLRTGKSALTREKSGRVPSVVTQARLEEVDSIARSGGSDPPLHLALTRGYDDVALALIARGEDVNQRGFAGLTPLHYVCDRSILEAPETRVELAGKLLAKGANPNVPDDKGLTPLHLAAECCAELVELLVRKGAKVDQPAAATGRTPLHLAAAAGLRDIIRTLIGLGANPATQDFLGRTPARDYAAYSDEHHEGAMDPKTARLLGLR